MTIKLQFWNTLNPTVEQSWTVGCGGAGYVTWEQEGKGQTRRKSDVHYVR